jgi:group I intron endonuclease
MDNKFIVYCTTNLINNKKYIGSHTRNLDEYLGSGVDITKAIKKYGKDNFTRQILAEVDSYELMRELEEYWCEYFDVENNKLFYNRTNKGIGSPRGWIMTQETRQTKNLSQINKPKHTQEGKQKLREQRLGIDYFGNKGKKLKESHRKKAAENRYKPILQYTIEGTFIKEWESATIVANQNGWNRANIHSCCRGKQKTSYNFIWKYKN